MGKGLYYSEESVIVLSKVDLKKGDNIPSEVTQRLVTSNGEDNFTISGDIVGVFGGESNISVVYRDSYNYWIQHFKESGDRFLVKGKPENVTSRILEMEDVHDIDFNGDGMFGELY